MRKSTLLHRPRLTFPCFILAAFVLLLPQVVLADETLAYDNLSPLYDNASSGYELYIEDYANLLTPSEEAQLTEVMKPITEYGNVIFLSINSNPSSTTERYVESFYQKHWGRESGTIFIIDMDERYIWIYSDGEIYKTITKSYATTITDNVYSFASDKEYYHCAEVAFSQISTLLEGQWIAQPMKWISNAFLAIALALFINYFVILYMSRAKKASTTQLLSSTEHHINITDARTKFTSQTRQYTPVSKSSGGSGRIGGGGGGGGGGHRF